MGMSTRSGSGGSTASGTAPKKPKPYVELPDESGHIIEYSLHMGKRGFFYKAKDGTVASIQEIESKLDSMTSKRNYKPSTDSTTSTDTTQATTAEKPAAKKFDLSESIRDHGIAVNVDRYIAQGMSGGSARERVARNLAMSGKFSLEEARGRVLSITEGDLSAKADAPAPMGPIQPPAMAGPQVPSSADPLDAPFYPRAPEVMKAEATQETARMISQSMMGVGNYPGEASPATKSAIPAISPVVPVFAEEMARRRARNKLTIGDSPDALEIAGKTFQNMNPF